MFELAIVSSRKVRLQQWADEGHKGASAALALAEHPTRFLSTIQIGITSISILSGVFGEAAISHHIEEWLLQFPILVPYSKPLSVTLMVIFITTLSLIFGELVPKRLAMHSPELVSVILARPMDALSRFSSPLVEVLSLLTDSLLRIMGVSKKQEPSITEKEIRVLMEQGADEGVFDQAEQEMVKNIFRLDNRKVASIMTPRKDIVSLDMENSQEENICLLHESPYSRFPVCKNGLEHVIGIVEAKRILDLALSGKVLDFSTNMTPPLYVPATVSLMQLLEQFKLSRIHIGLVVDEYGELEGLVTMNDVLEAIVGDLPDTTEDNDKRFVQRGDGSWLVDGIVTLEEFKDFFDLDHEELMPGEDTGNIHTIGGVMMFQLGRVPVVTDKLSWNNFSFEVVDMDKTRVDKVMVIRENIADEVIE